MDSTGNQTFKLTATKRFYEFFYPKIKNKEIDPSKFYLDFGADKYVNKSVFLGGLKAGDRNVTIDHIEIAYKKYGIHPDYLLGLTDVINKEGDYILEDPDPQYTDDSRKTTGEKLRAIFDKHKTNIKDYAEQRLKMTEQNLYKILRGEGRAYLDVVVTICEDHGESLDQFRKTPLPKGHLLQQVKTQQALIEVLQKRVDELENQLKNNLKQ